jgi:NDP-sugar pyrophosphorylase family protein
MQAVILAGGKGTRLRPFTATLPKPLVPIGDYPIIEVVLRQLRHFGFRDVVVSTGHLAELIEAYCGDGKRWGLKISYARERAPLGTAGALRFVRKLAPDFMTINGDILSTLDYGSLMTAHRRSGAWATVGVCDRETLVDFGVITLGKDGALAGYDEKPRLKHLVSMGVNVFDRRAVGLIAKGETLGMPEFIARLGDQDKLVRGQRCRCEWLDIGRPADYEQAQQLFADPKQRRRYLRRP